MAQAITQIPNCRVVPNGLLINANLRYSDWVKIGTKLDRLDGTVKWMIADWLAFGERKYGERYAEALKFTDYSIGTLMNMKYVASSIEISRRSETLSFAHHVEVASFKPQTQIRWLNTAERHGYSRLELREAIKTGRRPTGLKDVPDHVCQCKQCGRRF